MLLGSDCIIEELHLAGSQRPDGSDLSKSGYFPLSQEADECWPMCSSSVCCQGPGTLVTLCSSILVCGFHPHTCLMVKDGKRVSSHLVSIPGRRQEEDGLGIFQETVPKVTLRTDHIPETPGLICLRGPQLPEQLCIDPPQPDLAAYLSCNVPLLARLPYCHWGAGFHLTWAMGIGPMKLRHKLCLLLSHVHLHNWSIFIISPCPSSYWFSLLPYLMSPFPYP